MISGRWSVKLGSKAGMFCHLAWHGRFTRKSAAEPTGKLESNLLKGSTESQSPKSTLLLNNPWIAHVLKDADHVESFSRDEDRFLQSHESSRHICVIQVKVETAPGWYTLRICGMTLYFPMQIDSGGTLTARASKFKCERLYIFVYVEALPSNHEWGIRIPWIPGDREN